MSKMKFMAPLLALIGMQTVVSAAQTPAGAQPPFEYQLWAADHVVLTVALRSSDRVSYRLERVLKGNAVTLNFREPQILDVDDTVWQRLGKRASSGERALLLLRKPDGAARTHHVLELYLLGSGSRFTHAANDASVKQSLTINEVERLLRMPPFDTRGCGRVTVQGEYVLCSEILHGGTRSEGRIGRLYRHGVAVPGTQKGQVIETEPTGGGLKFIYRGAERPHLWSVSGWDVETPR